MVSYKHRRKNNDRATRGIRKNKPTLVVGKLHANWCGHCVALRPEWAKMKKMLNNVRNTFNVVFEEIEQAHEAHKVKRINNTHLSRSSNKLATQGGYPTLFKIKDGKLEYYNGERYAAPMAKWFSGGATSSEALPQKQAETSQSGFNFYKTFGLGGGGKTQKNRNKK